MRRWSTQRVLLLTTSSREKNSTTLRAEPANRDRFALLNVREVAEDKAEPLHMDEINT